MSREDVQNGTSRRDGLTYDGMITSHLHRSPTLSIDE